MSCERTSHSTQTTFEQMQHHVAQAQTWQQALQVTSVQVQHRFVAWIPELFHDNQQVRIEEAQSAEKHGDKLIEQPSTACATIGWHIEQGEQCLPSSAHSHSLIVWLQQWEQQHEHNDGEQFQLAFDQLCLRFQTHQPHELLSAHFEPFDTQFDC